MYKITFSVTVLQLNTAFKDFKDGFVNRIREEYKKYILRKAIIFGGVGPVLDRYVGFREVATRQISILFKFGLMLWLFEGCAMLHQKS